MSIGTAIYAGLMIMANRLIYHTTLVTIGHTYVWSTAMWPKNATNMQNRLNGIKK